MGDDDAGIVAVVIVDSVTQFVVISNEQLMVEGTVLVLRGHSIIQSKAECIQLLLKGFFVLGDGNNETFSRLVRCFSMLK